MCGSNLMIRRSMLAKELATDGKELGNINVAYSLPGLPTNTLVAIQRSSRTNRMKLLHSREKLNGLHS